MITDFLSKILKEKKGVAFSILFIIFLALFFYLLFASITFVMGTSSINSSVANLTVWDQTDQMGGSYSKYTVCSEYCSEKTKPTQNSWNTYFFANFTNITSKQNIIDANCTIRFRENLTVAYTGWKNMTYNSTTDAWVYNKSFNYKGNITGQVNCSSPSYSPELNTTDNLTIKNTPPYIKGEIGPSELPTQYIQEDILFYYNLSLDVSEDDYNDLILLSYSYNSSTTTLTNFALVGGLLTVNITTDSATGSKDFIWKVIDDGVIEDTSKLPFVISAVNDAPRFINLNNTMNATEGQLFDFTVQAADEESNIPYSFNITFVNCTTAGWSTRNSTDCNLFNSTFNATYYNSTAIRISFTPTNNDVGNYTIEFNITDSGNTVLPYNASRTKTIVFEVINVNNLPVITYLCDNERNASENTNFACWVTANDTDELYNLTFISNTTGFTFNNSKLFQTQNISSNTTAQINFTANDSMVGVWYINISVNDSSGGLSSRIINFNISNFNDNVSLSQINSSLEVYAWAKFYLEINASDDDLRIPVQGKSCTYGCYNESLSFTRTISGGPNSTLFNIVKNITTGNTTTAYILFTPTNSDAGNYTVNITVRDANDFSVSSRVFNLSIYFNTAPYWINLTATSFDAYDNSTFYLNLSSNATDFEGDKISFTDNTSLFDITLEGYVTFFANDSQVGMHNVTVTITDSSGAVNDSRTFMFTLHNINETPVVYPINNQIGTEDNLTTINFSANDEDLDLGLNYLASDFYPENLNWNISSTTSWFTAAKLNFTRIDNKSASISFTPNKTDVGTHIINISVIDSTGRMDSQEFTLTISGINHNPILDPIGSRNVTVNETFYLDINATDLEDGSDNVTGNNNFTFASNESWFNITINEGIVNLTLNSSYVGYHWINVSVNDSTGASDSEVFRLAVYSLNLPPVILDFMSPSLNINTIENCTSSILCPYFKTFWINLSDPNSGEPNNDTLTVIWNVDGIPNKTLTNVTPTGNWWTWGYVTNFSDEGIHNITVNVSDKLNLTVSHSWNVTVNHSNAPVIFIPFISHINATQPSSVAILRNLVDGSIEGGGHFFDIDHVDPLYNDPINFTFNVLNENCTDTNSTPLPAAISITNDSVMFYSELSQQGKTVFCINITGYDSHNQTIFARSNNFQVNLTATTPATVFVPSSGGGGGGSQSKKKVPIALKIVVPEPFSMFTHDKIVVPIKLQNRGQMELNKISVSAKSTLASVSTELEKNYFKLLVPGQEEKFDLTIITNTNQTGSYEVIINASVESPAYIDSASFFVNLIEMGWKEKIKAQEKIVFLEELLIGNPECLELTELLNEAKKELVTENYQKAIELSETAIQACKYAISSKGKAVEVKRKIDFGNLVIIFSLALLAILFLLFILNSYKRARFKRGKE